MSVKDVHNFLKDCSIEEGDKGVVLTTGIAFVTLSSREDVVKALKHDREYIGSRYIEVTESSPQQLDVSYQLSNDIGKTAVVRLRGIPYTCEKREIEDFFSGMANKLNS